MQKAVITFFLLAAFVSAPLVAQNFSSSEISPKELLASPERYVNQTVRLRGEITSCFNLGCSICEIGAAGSGERSCLALDFATDAKDPRVAARIEHSLQEQFRFSTVSIEAKFDPACLGSYLRGAPTRDGYITLPNGAKAGLCLDHASVLRDSRVVAVHSRKSGREFVAGDNRDVIAPPASAAERKAMMDVFQPAFAWRPDLKLEVFLAPPVAGESAFGYGCVCREEDCKDRWPAVHNATLDSPANPYRCFQMSRENGVWRITLSL